MCGFTGFLSKDNSLGVQQRRKMGADMLQTIAHRGPDAGDIWQDPDAGCLLAHRRLSIIDLSAEGAQPMESASGRYIMAYNGEVYNFLELRRDCEAKGTVFRGRSDTEVMLATIEAYGLNQALQKFNGMFAFALWDRKERTLHLARDRMGKKPLYVGWAGKTLVFGSELKALRAHPDFSAALNKDALTLYMRHACVPSPHCIYENVWSLPAGHRLKIDLESLAPAQNLSADMEAYWDHTEAMSTARMRKDENLSDDQAIAEFEALLGTCVEERMISDVPLGAFLSGGIDSSAVTALMQSRASKPVKTYSVGFQEAGFDESVYAAKVAAHLGTDHHEIKLGGRDALDVIPLLSTIYDEPFADISAIPTYLVCKFARADVTVALSGDGGDEMLGGYNRHVMGPKLWRRMRTMPKFARGILGALIRTVPPAQWSRALKNLPQAGTRVHKIADILSKGSEREIYMSLLSTFDDPASLVKGGGEPQIPLTDPAKQTNGLSFAEKMMLWDSMCYLPDDILVKVDRASMAVSLEARAPLLDKRIFDYSWSLPERFKIRNGQGKWLLREVLARHVPRELFERPKQGFAMPVGDWLTGELREWAEVLLDERAMQADGILDAKIVQKLWADHKAGRGNHAERLWTILMFQGWKEKWLG